MPDENQFERIEINVNKEQKDKIRLQLNSFRARVYKGEDFKVLAAFPRSQNANGLRQKQQFKRFSFEVP